MEWYERYKPGLLKVYRNALDSISSFPAPLDELGLGYAGKFNPVDKDGGKDYICTLLPFWLQEPASLSDEQCERLALANVYGMLYFFIQDDVMDSKVAGDDWKSQLALGNLLQLEMLCLLRELFPSDSPFWRYYDSYVRTWADSVVNEGRENYFLTNPLLVSGKAGPVKISVVAAWLLAASATSASPAVTSALAADAPSPVSEPLLPVELIETEERIRLSEEAVDTALMTLQMLDDWADWEDDLADGSYNGLLAMIAAGWDGPATDAPKAYDVAGLTKERIESAIYVRGCLKPYGEVALGYHARLLSNPCAPPDLIAFNAYMIDTLQATADRLEERKRKLLGGGINLLFGGTPLQSGLRPSSS